jgi:hypothetical protein
LNNEIKNNANQINTSILSDIDRFTKLEANR